MFILLTIKISAGGINDVIKKIFFSGDSQC